jgi:hypothetical protein
MEEERMKMEEERTKQRKGPRAKTAENSAIRSFPLPLR